MTCRLCASLCAVFTKSWLKVRRKGCSTTSGTSASAWSVTAFRFEHAPARAACRSDRHGMANRLRTRLPDHTSACARRRQELHLRRRCGNVGRCGVATKEASIASLNPLPTPSAFGGPGLTAASEQQSSTATSAARKARCAHTRPPLCPAARVALVRTQHTDMCCARDAQAKLH